MSALEDHARELVCRDVAESEIRSGGEADRTLAVEDIMDVYMDIQTRQEAKRVLELINIAEVTITFPEEDA